MADEFTVFLVIGLLILAVMLGMGSISYTGASTSQVIPVELITEPEAGQVVGVRGDETSRSDEFNFNLGEDADVHELGNKELFSGVLFGGNEISYMLTEDSDSLEIRFKVVRSNDLAPLTIMVGDNVIEQNVLPLGEYTLSVDGEIPKGTMVKIYPLSSLWQMWAPALYELEDIGITTTGFARRTFEYKFDMDDEFTYFNDARLEIRLDENAGSFKVTLNRDKVFSGYARDITVIDLEEEFFVEGENIILMEADESSLLAGEAKLLIFYDEQVDHDITVDFIVNEDEYDRFRMGTVTFKVFDVQRDGGMSVKIIKGDEVLYNEFKSVSGRTYTFYLDKQHISPGVNVLKIDALEGVSFKIKDLDITLR